MVSRLRAEWLKYYSIPIRLGRSCLSISRCKKKLALLYWPWLVVRGWECQSSNSLRDCFLLWRQGSILSYSLISPTPSKFQYALGIKHLNRIVPGIVLIDFELCCHRFNFWPKSKVGIIDLYSHIYSLAQLKKTIILKNTGFNNKIVSWKYCDQIICREYVGI